MEPTWTPLNMSMSTESSTISQEQASQSYSNGQICALIVYSVVFVVGTFGNGLVIYVTGFKMKTTVNSVWFLNLSLADFFFTFFLVFHIVTVSRHSEWLFGDFMCKFLSLVSVLNMFASIFLLTGISIDRCVCTWVVVWTQNKRTPQKVRVICSLIWLVAIICSVPFVIFRGTKPHLTKTYCAYTYTQESKTGTKLLIFRFVMGFLIPFIIIMCSYMAIMVRARRLQRRRKLKPFRIVLAVILSFFFCWLPFHILQFIDLHIRLAFEKQQEVHQALMSINRTAGHYVLNLAYFNSCLNPILYVFMCEEFQKKIKQSLLLVLESAFAEEHLAFLSSRYSVSSHHSDCQGALERKDTVTSLVAHADKVVFSKEEES